MRPILFFLLTVFSIVSQAQNITGVIKDPQGTPVSGATVSLLKAKDSAVVKFTVTRDNGVYQFAGIPAGEYRISASHISFAPLVSAPVAVAGDVTVPELQLAKTANNNLNGVTVTARKPMVEVKADKMIVNVEGTINAVGSDALDLLRKSPGVMVDKDDNLSLAGKNGVQVYIDGRPSPLGGQDLANYLRSLQSAQIESIELITNPSAKYEAAGNAGIINIRLKKNKAFGTNGTVNAGYNVGVYSKYNGGFSLNHRNAKVNLFGNYNYSDNKMLTRMGINRTIADSVFDSKANMVMHNKSHNFKVGADYFINKMSTLGVIVNGTLSDMGITNYSRTPIATKAGVVDRILVADNRNTRGNDNLNYNLNYTYNNPKGKSLNLNADYGSFRIRNIQWQPNFYFDASGTTEQNRVIYEMLAPSNINIASVKGDWEQTLGKGKLGFGGKVSYVESDNDFQRYDVLTSGKVLDRDRSNRFIYKENINAGYVNYNRAFKGFMIQAGLRVENTVIEGISQGQKANGGGNYSKYDSTFRRNYTNLFPSAAITFNKNPMSQWSLTYSRRIDRPVYQDLNPFEFKLDQYTYQKGNIDLRPQYTNSFGLTHTYKYKLNTTINYSHVQDMFVQWIDTADRSKSFLNKRNLASQDIISVNMSYPIMYKKYRVFMNMNANYADYKADFGAGRKVNQSAFGFSFYAQNSLSFAKTWTAELTGFYNAPTIMQGAFRSRTLWSMDMGLQKQIMQGRATIKASVSDVFNTLRFQGTTDFAGQRTTINSNWETRQFKLALSFRFGNNGVKAARQRSGGAEEETKRAQGGGGGGMGIGQ